MHIRSKIVTGNLMVIDGGYFDSNGASCLFCYRKFYGSSYELYDDSPFHLFRALGIEHCLGVGIALGRD